MAKRARKATWAVLPGSITPRSDVRFSTIPPSAMGHDQFASASGAQATRTRMRRTRSKSRRAARAGARVAPAAGRVAPAAAAPVSGSVHVSGLLRPRAIARASDRFTPRRAELRARNRRACFVSLRQERHDQPKVSAIERAEAFGSRHLSADVRSCCRSPITSGAYRRGLTPCSRSQWTTWWIQIGSDLWAMNRCPVLGRINCETSQPQFPW
jgi:hypothetical protein